MTLKIKSSDNKRKPGFKNFSVQSNKNVFSLSMSGNAPTILGIPPDPSFCKAPGVPGNHREIFQSAHKAARNIVLTAKQSLQSAPVVNRPQAQR